MGRPDHLPDFADPPLNEVVLGAQFAPIPDFTAVDSKDVWILFKDEFPHVQEQHLLDPQFETFGGGIQQPGIHFQVNTRPSGSRLWFLSSDKNHLLQFQSDRFLTNWRKTTNLDRYPRYEFIAETFESNFNILAQHFRKKFSCEIDVNQAEITYINVIRVDDFSEISKWFGVLDFGDFNVESLNMSFNEVALDDDGKPFARLIHEIQSVFTADGKHRAFRLTISLKGKPFGDDIAATMNFYNTGREKIVERFAEMTTEEAHKHWGRNN